MKKQNPNKEKLRMQMLAGVITESQYKIMLTENHMPEEFEDLLLGMADGEINDYLDEGDVVEGVWELSEYGDDNTYDSAEEFKAAYNFIENNGGQYVIEGNPDIFVSITPEGIKYKFTVTLD